MTERVDSNTGYNKSYDDLTHKMVDIIPPWIALRPKCRSYTVEKEVNWLHRHLVTQTQSEKTCNEACLEIRSMQQKREQLKWDTGFTCFVHSYMLEKWKVMTGDKDCSITEMFLKIERVLDGRSLNTASCTN
jgi:hypothetical protein